MRTTAEQDAEIAAARAVRHETRRPTVPALEEVLFEVRPVLDHGFVRVIDYMGDDAAIVQAARVSYGRGTKRVSEDRGLIRYLMRHHHTTPFEMCELKLHCKLPIFVARQWIRHRTACLAGDTVLSFDVPGAERRERRPHRGVPLATLHRLWHEGPQVRQGQRRPIVNVSIRERLRAMRLRMCNEATGAIEHTHLIDVWATGVRPVFTVHLENGYRLRMTKDHRCLTERGWRTLEAATGLRLRDEGGVTWRTDAPAFAVNGVPSENLLSLWTPCRPAVKTRPEPCRVWRGFSRVRSIDFAGEEPTYDVAVSGPFHNFVANGFIVHNSVNEYSGRYSVLDREFYVPPADALGVQSSQNRQGRAQRLTAERAAAVLRLLQEDAARCYDHYQDLLNEDDAGQPLRPGEPGLARELARIALTLGYYTQWYWKIDLHNLFHFLMLRADPHAQEEIRAYALAIGDVVQRWVPNAWEAFVDFRLEAMMLSRGEREAVRRLLAGEAVDLAALGLSKREQDELRAKLGVGGPGR
jgi:flavin-dependent thymidylate synthase